MQRYSACNTYSEVTPLRADLEKPKTPCLIETCVKITFIIVCAKTLEGVHLEQKETRITSHGPLRHWSLKDSEKQYSGHGVRLFCAWGKEKKVPS